MASGAFVRLAEWIRSREPLSSGQGRHFAAVFDALPVGIVVAENPGGQIVSMNRACKHLVPQAWKSAPGAGGEALGLFRIDETPCPPEVLPLVRALAGESVGPESYKVRRGETWRVLELHAAPLGAGSDFEGAALLLIDVTERWDMDDQRDLYLAALAHDLRNPLNAVRLGAESLSLQPDSASRVLRIAARLGRSSARMAYLVDSLFDLTRSMSGRLVLETSSTELAEVVQRAINAVQANHPDREIRVEGEGGTGLWDSDRLCRVVQGLLLSSIEKGAPDQAIEVSLSADSGRAKLVISGTSSVEAAGEERACEAERGESARAELRVVIARRIVGAHGGSFTDSSEAEAIRFVIELPEAS